MTHPEVVSLSATTVPCAARQAITNRRLPAEETLEENELTFIDHWCGEEKRCETPSGIQDAEAIFRAFARPMNG